MEVLVMEKWDLQMGVLVIFNGRIIEKKRGVFHCHVWLPDGRLWNCSVLILGQVGIDHTSPPKKYIRLKIVCLQFFALHLRVMYEKGHLRRRLITLGWSNVARLIGNIWKHHLQTFSFSAMFGHQSVSILILDGKSLLYCVVVEKLMSTGNIFQPVSFQAAVSRIRSYCTLHPHKPCEWILTTPTDLWGIQFSEAIPIWGCWSWHHLHIPSQCDYRL